MMQEELDIKACMSNIVKKHMEIKKCLSSLKSHIVGIDARRDLEIIAKNTDAIHVLYEASFRHIIDSHEEYVGKVDDITGGDYKKEPV